MAIGQFYQKIVKNAPILKNQFYVSMNGAMPSGSSIISQELHYYARGAKLPEFTVKSADLSFHGQTFKVPTICEFNHDYDLVVYCDKEMKLWKFWKKWLEELSQFEHSGGVSRSGILKGKRGVSDTHIKLDVLKDVMFTQAAGSPPSESDIITTYTIEGVFPVKVGQIEFAHEDATIITFPISLQYQYFYEANNDKLK